MTRHTRATDRHRGSGWTRLAVVLTAAIGTAACGGATRTDTTPAPPQTRNVVRIGNYAPIEFFNEQLENKRQSLTTEFANLELAIAGLQNQQLALGSISAPSFQF